MERLLLPSRTTPASREPSPSTARGARTGAASFKSSVSSSNLFISSVSEIYGYQRCSNTFDPSMHVLDRICYLRRGHVESISSNLIFDVWHFDILEHKSFHSSANHSDPNDLPQLNERYCNATFDAGKIAREDRPCYNIANFRN